MTNKADKEEHDAMMLSFNKIPDNLGTMTFLELSLELASSEKDSAKFHVVERELKKHLAKDQATINRRNVIIGACIGGFFSLIGVLVGASLRTCPPTNNVAPS